jgi:hypothetical protein
MTDVHDFIVLISPAIPATAPIRTSTVVMNTDNLKAAVCHDYVCAEYKNSYRNGENFISERLPPGGL